MKIIPLEQLPSRGLLIQDTQKYPHLEIQRLQMKQMSLFSTAVTNDNPESFVEGIRSLLNIPLKYLTIGDFYYVVTYLRCNLRTPLSLSWTCDGFWYHTSDSNELIKAPEARRIVEDPQQEGVKLVPESCGTTNKETFGIEDLAVVYLPETVELDPDFAIPNAGLVAEYIRLSKDPSMAQIIPSIQWIREGNLLRHKLEWLQQQGDNDIDILDQAGEYNDIYAHGISNLLIGECRHCGTKVKQKIALSAESFFRNT